jgi:D-methionine transport system ATP-binding protein
LNRLVDPTSGTILVQNTPIHQIPILDLRRQHTLLLQDSKLLGMTVREAIAYPLRLRSYPPDQIQQQTQYWQDQLQIPRDWLDRTELQLSAGQRQLVAIARALIGEPKLLLLDEPTSALDLGLSQRVLGLLSNLARTQGLTWVMANHQLDFVGQFCDRLLYLDQGRLQENLDIEQVNWPQLETWLTEAAQANQAW